MARKPENEPWKKDAPRKSSHTKLTKKSKAKAKASAKRAGRKYPNLVDNMRAAKKQKGAKKSGSKFKPKKKS